MQKKLLELKAEADREGLLRHRQLAALRYPLDPDGVYLFYYSGKLYGWYTLSWKKGGFLHLKKHKGKPVFYYRPVGASPDFGPTEKKKIFAIFRSENRPSRETALRILQSPAVDADSGRSFRVEWTSPEAAELAGSHEVRLDEYLENALSERLTLTPPAPGLSMKCVQEIGERLYQTFFPESLRRVL
ncbi:MAG: hypothetical protein JNM63_18510, partial [Spirochaetia bacterium]|nr:hypothetical protein [Spirochaetia bacterium]